MRIYIATIGSRGDTEPFRALALEASSAGHEVFFAHTTDFVDTSEGRYHDRVIRGSFQSLIQEQGVSVLKALATYTSVMRPLLDAAWEDVTDHIVSIRPDVVVYHPKLLTAPVAAHHVGAIAVIAEMFPTLTPTREFAAAGAPSWLPRFLNTLSFAVVRAGLAVFTKPTEDLAKKLGVVNTHPDLTVCPVSPSVVAQPADWPEWAFVTGAWVSPSTGQLDDELENFLSSGPIVYAGFGSMKDNRAAARAAALVEGGKSAGFKVLLVTGWGGLAPSVEHVEDPDVLVRDSVPHALVLPRVAVAVHHGGAGTTHAALRAGTPSVIMPFLADQPWWARRLHSLGLGPKALSRKTTNPTVISQALLGALDFVGAVEKVADTMVLENGLGNTLTLIEEAESGQLPIRPA